MNIMNMPNMNNDKRTIGTQPVRFINSESNLIAIKTNNSCLQKSRKKLSILFVIKFILTILLLVVLIVFSVLYAKVNRPIQLCENESCMRIAASLKESMNTSIDPCDDFYKYACGRWSKYHFPLDLSQEYSWFTEKSIKIITSIRDLLLKNSSSADSPWAVKEAKALFHSCVDVETRNELGLGPLLDLLNELDLSHVPPTITKNTTNFIRQMAKVKRVLWSDIFFGTYIYDDPRDNNKNVIVLDLPDTTSPFPSDKVLEKRLRFIKTRVRSVANEMDGIDEETEAFLSAEKIYMSEVMKQIISNDTTDQRSCKSRKPFSLVPEDDIQSTVNRVYELSEVFYTVREEEV